MTTKRRYTVQELSGNLPYIQIRGKWLRDFGLDSGSMIYLEYVDGKMILTKVPDEEAEQFRLQKKIKKLEKELLISVEELQFLKSQTV
jgi:hypothetical protein